MISAAPLAKVGFMSADINLFLAGVLGFGFGFMLERSGFSSSKRMALQWFGKDWSVFRVMFTAIVTAMFGTVILDSLGIMPFGSYYINTTYLYPQIIGGLLMGVGFVIGGYCPGTSFVAMVSGKIDALFYILGMAVGVIVFAYGYPLFEGLYNSGKMGSYTLFEMFGINAWVMAFIVLILAVAGIFGANIIEKKLNQ